MTKNSKYALPEKYRPSNLDEVFGNEPTIEALRVILSRKQGIPHAFLFQGPKGCGKTTLAEIVATELGCSKRDFLIYNTANTRGIDTIRDIISHCSYAPLQGKVKVYLLDESHEITTQAQDALLKTLEKPPDHVYFILCTTRPEKLLDTVRDRCTIFQVATLHRTTTIKLLNSVCKQENVTLSTDLLKEITSVAGGCPRRALNLLDQIIDLNDEALAKQVLIESTVDEAGVLDLCRLLISDKKDKWKEVSSLLKTIGQDPEQVRYSILGYFSQITLSNPSDKLDMATELFLSSFMYTGKVGLIHACRLLCKM